MRRFVVFARPPQRSLPNHVGRWVAALLLIAFIAADVAGELRTYKDWWSIGDIQAVIVDDEMWIFVETDHWSERSGFLRRPYTVTVGGLSVLVLTPSGLKSKYELTNLSEIDFNSYAAIVHVCDDKVFLYDIGSQGRPPNLFEWQRDHFQPLAKDQEWSLRDPCILNVIARKNLNRVLATTFRGKSDIIVGWGKQTLTFETNPALDINSKSNNVIITITAKGPQSKWRTTLNTLPTRIGEKGSRRKKGSGAD